MLATVCNEIRNAVLDYISINIGAFLIYYPDLGLTDSPTIEQYNRRKGLTMVEAVSREVGGYYLNGYKRYIPRPDELFISQEHPFIFIKLYPKFQAIDGIIGPFTHICLSTNMNTYGGNASNGNNRGDSQGNIIMVKPVPVRELKRIDGRPDIPIGALGLVLEHLTEYKTEMILQINSRVFD